MVPDGSPAHRAWSVDSTIDEYDASSASNRLGFLQPETSLKEGTRDWQGSISMVTTRN